MSLPGPLPYEPKRFGAVRDAPTKRAMRPYAERLALAPKLLKDSAVRPGSLVEGAPKFAELFLVLGAFAPVVLAIPGFGSLFADVVVASYPVSAGLFYSTLWLEAGWAGAALLLVTGAVGLFIAGVGGKGRRGGANRTLGAVRWAGGALFFLAVAGVTYASGWTTVFAGSVGAAWVVLTGAAAVYGAYLVARRESWLGALGGALALIAGGRVIFGCAALVAIVAADKAFPGQVVARHPWKRSQVAMLPPAAPLVLGEAPDDGSHIGRRAPPAQALQVGTLALVFGAFSPLVLAIPGFGVGLFGGLLFALWPVSVFAIWSAGSVVLAFGALAAGGPGALWGLLVVLWLVVLPALGGLVAARAVTARRRRFAAVAGAVLLAVGGRPLFAVTALVCIGWAWGLFDQAPGETAAAEHAQGAAAD